MATNWISTVATLALVARGTVANRVAELQVRTAKRAETAAFGALAFAGALLSALGAVALLGWAAMAGLIAQGLSPAASALIIALGFLALTAIFGLIGRSLMRQALNLRHEG